MQNSETNDLAWRLIEDIRTCMMITHCEFPQLRARPMRGIAEPANNTIWFLSDLDSEKSSEVFCAPTTCLTYANPKSNCFVSLSGKTEIIKAKSKIEELWNDHFSAYWPEGPEDPNAVLLKFTPEFGEYWEAPGNALVLALKFIEAKITGAQPDLGKNAKLKMI